MGLMEKVTLSFTSLIKNTKKYLPLTQGLAVEFFYLLVINLNLMLNTPYRLINWWGSESVINYLYFSNSDLILSKKSSAGLEKT